MPKRVSPERREELLRAFLGAKAAGATAQPTEVRPPPRTQLTTRKYIQEQLDGLQPLIAECFREARKTDPSLKPELPVAFTIGGEPGVGGIVTEVELQPELAKQQVLMECVEETLFSLEIDPPERDESGAVGEVRVRYSFKIEDDEGG